MPTMVDCPSCTRKLRVADDLLGQRCRCPTCGQTFDATAPGENAAPTERAPEAASPPNLSPPTPAPASVETVPLHLSLDEMDKPARPGGYLPAPPVPQKQERRREFIRCPNCDERISADSRRCRHCGEDLDEADEFNIRRRQGVRRDCEPHRGTLILVLGIVSIVIHALGLPIGLPAWIMGRRDLAKMDRGEMDPSGRSTTQAGYICGIIGTILGSLTVLACAAYFALFAVLVSSTAGSGMPPPGKSQPMAPNPPPGRMR